MRGDARRATAPERALPPHARARHGRLHLRREHSRRPSVAARLRTLVLATPPVNSTDGLEGAELVRALVADPAYQLQMTIDRRDFLKLAVARRRSRRAARIRRAAAEPSRKLLVLVELKGGNDGLNTVIPYADPPVRGAAAAPCDRARPGGAAQPSARACIRRSRRCARCGTRASSRSCRAWAIPQPEPLAFPLHRDLGHRLDERRVPRRGLARARLRAVAVARGLRRRRRRGRAQRDGAALGQRRTRDRAHQSGAVPAQRAPRARRGRIAQRRARPHPARRARRARSPRERLQAGRKFATEFPTNPFGNSVEHRRAARRRTRRASRWCASRSAASTRTRTSSGTHANLLKQLAEGLAALREALVEIGPLGFDA